MTYFLAVDIGASSGRHMLCHVQDGRIHLQEVYRFQNVQVEKNGHRCWDIEGLFRHILAGMKACKEQGCVPVAMGIDTWAVDFVLLNGDRQLLGDAVAYRDDRTKGMEDVLEEILPFSELYRRTGIQKQSFNTIYQLLALKREHPEQLAAAKYFLMIPDYLHFRLTGQCANEYTNATSTALVSLETKEWDGELIRQIGLPAGLFAALRQPGSSLGGLSRGVQAEVGFDCEVVLPATHDTASAFLAVPAKEKDALVLSSGTWSLMGMERQTPITTTAGRNANFTNEGGYEGRFRYLKNIMGLWMIQSIRKETQNRYSFADLERMAREADDFTGTVDAEDARFLAPASMLKAVQSACRQDGQPVPESIGDVMQCVYQSLAKCYRETAAQLKSLTGTPHTCLHIVGGGSKDGYLNQLTANALDIPVYAGPTEGTALGNLLVQMIAKGVFSGLPQARAAVRDSFPVKRYEPTGGMK